MFTCPVFGLTFAAAIKSWRFIATRTLPKFYNVKGVICIAVIAKLNRFQYRSFSAYATDRVD